jgi:hypothetical protein
MSRPNWNQHEVFKEWLLSVEYAVMRDGKFYLYLPDGVACYMYEAWWAGKEDQSES